jgi:HTH-type transcriptional regulator/antitoxin HigA
MDIRPIKSEGDYNRVRCEIEELWEAKPSTLESERLELLSILVEAFERENYPIPPPDPIAAIEHCMERRGLTRKDLEPLIGSRARVSEVMTRRRPLALPMIRRLTAGLAIPPDVLIQPYRTVAAYTGKRPDNAEADSVVFQRNAAAGNVPNWPTNDFRSHRTESI